MKTAGYQVHFRNKIKE